jgi:hypothetical protein
MTDKKKPDPTPPEKPINDSDWGRKQEDRTSDWFKPPEPTPQDQKSD